MEKRHLAQTTVETHAAPRDRTQTGGMSTLPWLQITCAVVVVLLVCWLLYIAYPAVSRYSFWLGIVVAVVCAGLALCVLALAVIAVFAVFVKHVEMPRKQHQATATDGPEEDVSIQLLRMELQHKESSEMRAYTLEQQRIALAASRVGFDTQVLLGPDGALLNLPSTHIEMERAISVGRAKQLTAGDGQAPNQEKASAVIVSEFPERRAFSDIFKTFKPTPDGIFMLDTVNGPIIEPMLDVTHLAQIGPTGGGKTMNMRATMSQFLYCGAIMYFASPNFAQLKLNESYLEDWRPIVAHLQEPVAQTTEEIDALLDRMLALLETRKKAEQHSPRRGADLVAGFGEWPGIVSRNPKAQEKMMLLLRESRQYGIHIFLEMQDALVKSIGMNSGARENIRHAYYFGGDSTSAKFALNLANGVKIDETGLGINGAVYMRARSTNAVVSGRIPLFNNAALYMLLGTPPDPVPDYPIRDEREIPETYYHVDENGEYVEGSVEILVENGQENANAPETSYAPTSQADAYTISGAPMLPQYAPKTLTEGQEMARQKSDMRPLPDTAHTTLDGRQEDYKRMSEIQQVQFLAAYRVKPNVDVCLKQVGCSNLYRTHAKHLLRSEGLID